MSLMPSWGKHARVSTTTPWWVESSPGTQPVGVDIRAYQVVVTGENPHRVLPVDLPASATSPTVPEEFLEYRTSCALDVLAIEADGSRSSPRWRSR